MLIYKYTDLKFNLGWHTHSQSLTALHTHTDSKLDLSLQKHRSTTFLWFIHTQMPTLFFSLCFICMLAVVTSVCDYYRFESLTFVDYSFLVHIWWQLWLELLWPDI